MSQYAHAVRQGAPLRREHDGAPDSESFGECAAVQAESNASRSAIPSGADLPRSVSSVHIRALFMVLNPDAFSLVVGSQVVVLSDVPRKSTQQCLFMIVGPRADKRCDNVKMTTHLKAPECVASPVFFWDCRDPEASSDRSLVNETEQLDLESPTWACLSGVRVFGRPHKPSSQLLLKAASGSRSK